MPEDNANNPHHEQIEDAYQFFKNKLESEKTFTIADIRRVTGYQDSTVDEHMRVRWKRWFLDKLEDGTYRSRKTLKDYGKQFFIDMHTQNWVNWIHPPEPEQPSSEQTATTSPDPIPAPPTDPPKPEPQNDKHQHPVSLFLTSQLTKIMLLLLAVIQSIKRQEEH
jgi:hypothetical protein